MFNSKNPNLINQGNLLGQAATETKAGMEKVKGLETKGLKDNVPMEQEVTRLDQTEVMRVVILSTKMHRLEE